MRSLLLLAAACALACSDSTRTTGHTELQLTNPPDGAQLFSGDGLLVRATADDNAGVKSLALLVGTRLAKSCPFAPSSTDLAVCATTVQPTDFAAQVQHGALTVWVRLVNGDGLSSVRSAEVVVSPLVVRFTAPANSAKLSGPSSLAVDVRAEVPVQLVTVTADDGRVPIHQWEPSAAYAGDVDWAADLEPGPHTLVATATDVQQRTATAKVDVVVLCEAAADCAAGQQCCRGACAATCP